MEKIEFKTKSIDVYVAIRHNKYDGYYFMDTTCISCDHEMCLRLANIADLEIPVISSANPVVKIGKAKLIFED